MNSKVGLLVVSWLLSGSCASVPHVELEDSLTTSNGVRISFNACATPVVVGEGKYQLQNVVLTVDGRQRSNPRFDFINGSIDRRLANSASTIMRLFTDTFKWACASMSKEASLAGRPVTARDFELLRFHEEALKATVDTALRIERQTTDAGYEREIAAGDALLQSFREREPESWRGLFPHRVPPIEPVMPL